MTQTTSTDAVIEMRGITKRFGSVLANDRVDFDLKKGEIHALLGENGAGKSTLMGVLYGLYKHDEGEIFMNGEELHLSSSADAINKRIGMIHQHFMLIPTLSVVENIVLCREKGLKKLDLKKAAKQIEEMSKAYGLGIDPWETVCNLSVGQQQRVEILKVLYRGADVLIMDEPTAVLTPGEVKELFKILRDITASGSSVVFISHKLWEVIEISDRITVMFNGVKVNTIENKGVTTSELAAMMVGREVILKYEKNNRKPGAPVLKMNDVFCKDDRNLPCLKNVSLSVREGEIVGIAGVDGNGQKELAEVIHGVRKLTNGTVCINGIDVTGKKPKEVLAAGLCHIPEDRHACAVVLDFTISENIALMDCDKKPFAKHGFIDSAATEKIAEKLREQFAIKCASVDDTLKELSGGNQQKVVLAREIYRNPKFLIAAQPSRGLDIGATEYIQHLLVDKRNNGMGVLLISSDLDEILAVSDRVIVLYEGEIMGEAIPGVTSTTEIGMMMAGIKQSNEGGIRA